MVNAGKANMKRQSRRSFVTSLAGISALALLAPFERLIAAQRNKVKITDIKTMVFKGPGNPYMTARTYNLVKVETDVGLFGVAEAYGTPGLGVKEEIHGLKNIFIGKTPWGLIVCIRDTAIRMAVPMPSNGR